MALASSVFHLGSKYLPSTQHKAAAAAACCRIPRILTHHRSPLSLRRCHNRFARIHCSLDSQKSNTKEMDCVGTGQDVECLYDSSSQDTEASQNKKLLPNLSIPVIDDTVLSEVADTLVLISPFFFWGTSMVAMKEVLPKTGPFFLAAVRLIPAGALLVGYALFRERKLPSGFMAWLAISLFGLVDAGCFQGFLAEGLLKTTAGLGSVIIDSQPLTVAVLAAILFGESITVLGTTGLILAVIGLILLEGNAIDKNFTSLWGSGEWWMLLAAQSMAIGTVMVRWVCKYSDPIMATGWHMIIGGLPLIGLSVIHQDPVFTGKVLELNYSDWVALMYTSVFGSAISYGLYFYNATRGSLTKLSSLTFLTPMFASVFGYLFLDETFSSVQLVGALITVGGIYLVNTR